MGARRPDPERRACGVGDDRDPAAVESVERLHEDAAAGVGGFRDGCVDVVDPDVGGPGGHGGAPSGREATAATSRPRKLHM